MGLIRWIKEKLGFDEDDFDDIELGYSSDNAESLMESLSNVSKRRRSLDMNDMSARQQYVRDYCDMMALASKDVDEQKVEYQKVTDRLVDLDEIDKLPMTDKSQVRLRAKKVIQIEDEQTNYVRPSRKITEAQYREMDRLKDELPDVLKKMKENEDYQMVVRRDLNLLEGEKGAIAYVRKEERANVVKSRNFAFIGTFAAIMAVILLFVVNQAMRIDVYIGYIITAGVYAIILTAVFVKFQNAQSGITVANRKLNKIIGLQNSVKIKYVNVTNVLDYNYAKYGVMNSYELEYKWDKYNEEKKARAHDTELSIRLDTARSELFQILKHYHIKDPSALVYEPGILIDDHEEKEIRKELIVQRQRLKKGIDFEMYNLEVAKKELYSLVTEYPQYAKEIIAIVEQYE